MKMDCIILAGGFARRMRPLTKNRPKQLLPVGGKPMLQYVLDRVCASDAVSRVWISVNSRFASQFAAFLRSYKAPKDVKLVVEPCMSESGKLGSLGALGYVMDKVRIGKEVMIVGGDNLFEFDLDDMAAFYSRKQGSVIAFCDIGIRERAALYGIGTVDDEGKLTAFQEKPRLLAATACYILSGKGTRALRRYMAEGNNCDAMGNYIEWLLKKGIEVYAFSFSGMWFDIGSIESYNRADELLGSINKRNRGRHNGKKGNTCRG